jgi:hypothetical protein
MTGRLRTAGATTVLELLGTKEVASGFNLEDDIAFCKCASVAGAGESKAVTISTARSKEKAMGEKEYSRVESLLLYPVEHARRANALSG